MRRAPMCSGASFLFCLLVLFALILATCTHAAKPSYLRQFNRNCFPAGFLFGSGSATYQEQQMNMEEDQAYGKLLFVRPITFGDYPKSMRSAVGSRLPKFSEAQSKMLKGSLDFLGVNYCTTNYVENAPSSNKVNLSYADDRRIKLTTEKKGVSIGLPAYYVWTFLDDFEWDAGYTVRFGLTYIDFKNNLKRYLKYSAYWLKMFLLK
ncbi:Glycoside hydrolase family 1 - like 1 [Theobroma cacao]|nr:Glycoside hydrolase family 1 - like 1 [Theobroma cacao]